MSEAETSSYDRARERLEEIVQQIRSKDVSLEKSLDLYEEALRLGAQAADLIDRTDFTSQELAALETTDTNVLDDQEPAAELNDDPDEPELAGHQAADPLLPADGPAGETALENPED
ncbi:MAG: exodeoxyribonuclease VII small subunit [Actinomycetia bacterium]|nr:exodeoxyribonuclease VII small subunit [Actinomycetes bacterium]